MGVCKTIDEATQVRVTRCDSWDDFIREMRVGEGRYLGGLEHMFRGHAKREWKLSSIHERSLEQLRADRRDQPFSEMFSEGRRGLAKYREWYLEPFKREASRLCSEELPPWDKNDAWLAFGRHHGLITPLLDWTHSPYVAAFFAFTAALALANENWGRADPFTGGFSLPADPVAIWALAPAKEAFEDGVFELVDTVPYANARMRAQEAAFTKLTHDLHADVAGYLASRGVGHRLERFELPGQAAGKALHDLHLMRINYATMYPDMDGIATQVNLGVTWKKLNL